MAYIKTTWQNDQAPAINATNLNHIEDGIFNNDIMLSSILTTLGINATTWVSTDAYVEGQSVVYNNTIYKNITGNYTTTSPAEDTTNWQQTTLLDIQYPIGKTELFYDNLDHSNYMGFTWERTAIGRTIVGQDTNDTDFDTIGETGGSKTHTLTVNEMPSHNHTVVPYATTSSGGSATDIYVSGGNGAPTYYGSTGNKGGGQPHSILQPYQVFAIWKRIS